MASWVADQWKQIRGHVKYELIRAAVFALAGSGVIAASSAMLHKRFQGVGSDWFVFGAIFCCSLLVLALSLFRPGPTPPDKTSQPANRLKIESFDETIKLGALWTVPTSLYFHLSIEVLEITNENEVTIELTSHSIQYAGANVQVIQKNLGFNAGRYVLHRASVAYGNDCVSHWDMGESTFSGFYVYLSHANKFAQEATIGVFAIDAYSPPLEPTANSAPEKPQIQST
jgi:hypothetical protein